MDMRRHIKRLRRECSRIQEHGHLEGVPDGYVAISDIEIKIKQLEEAMERRIKD